MCVSGNPIGLSLLAAPILVFAIVSQGGIARAEQDIPALPAQPVIAQTMLAGGGESYPAFAGDRAPIMSERLVADDGGEHYPTFANPGNGGSAADYAALGPSKRLVHSAARKRLAEGG